MSTLWRGQPIGAQRAFIRAAADMLAERLRNSSPGAETRRARPSTDDKRGTCVSVDGQPTVSGV